VSKNRGDRWSSLAHDKEQSRELSVGEVARFLKRLSSFYRDPKTGNPALSNALAELALALSQRRDLTLTKAVADIDISSKRRRSLEASRLKDLGLEEVKEMLSDEDMTKADLIDLGAERFAIPRSGLQRMNTDQVSGAIRSALRHEESLNILEREAQRGGKERSS
jgi:hypothetical protein